MIKQLISIRSADHNHAHVNNPQQMSTAEKGLITAEISYQRFTYLLHNACLSMPVFITLESSYYHQGLKLGTPADPELEF